jgi:hypothetical protein
MISFLSRTIDFFFFGFICGWLRPVSSRSAKQPGWRSPPIIVTIVTIDLPQDVIRSVARFRLRIHTLRYETATWNPTSCDLCEADDDVQVEKHVLLHCTHPQMISLCRKYTFLFSQAEMCLHFYTRTTINSIFVFSRTCCTLLTDEQSWLKASLM